MENGMEAATPDAHASGALSSRRRIGLVICLQLGLLVGAKLTGVTDAFDRDSLQATATRSGTAGMLAFAVTFAVGELLHVPGLVFVAAAVVTWGTVRGGLIAFASGVFTVSVGFAVTRGIRGGATLDSVGLPSWVTKRLETLEARPIATVAGLRVLVFLSPGANVAFALTGISFRDHLIGSAAGLVLPMMVWVGVIGAVTS